MPTTTPRQIPIKLPQRIDAAFLAKHQREGEPLVVLKVSGIGNSAPYEYRGGGGRSYVLRWDLKQCAHLLRIPLHLWRQNDHAMAHDLLEHDDRPLPIVVLVEEAAVRAPRLANGGRPAGGAAASGGASEGNVARRAVAPCLGRATVF